MSKIIAVISLVIITAVLGGCQSSTIYGSGPISLSDATERVYQNYLSKNSPLAFMVSKDGRVAYFTYCDVGIQCLDDSYAAVARCESRYGVDCFVFAENGKIVWKGYTKLDSATEESATFSINVFGGNTLYSGYLVSPKSSDTFTLNIGNGNICEGFYKSGNKFIVGLNCENDSSRGDIRKANYKGEIRSFSWDEGNDLILRAPGEKFLEMQIYPYKGKVRSGRNESVKHLSVQQADKIEKPDVPVEIKWANQSGSIRGELKYSNKPGGGFIKLKVNESGVNCSGSWKFSKGSYKNNGMVQGVWAVSCSDGKTVTGEYESSEKGSGSGEGFDNNGEKVTIRYGEFAR
jgi:hypothetical protein